MQVRGTLVAGALVVSVAACSGGSSDGSAGPSPSMSPTYTQLGTLAISNVVASRAYTSVDCPSMSSAFPAALSGGAVACDPHTRTVYLLAAPTADQRDVSATTVGKEPHGTGWSVYLLLTRQGAKAVQSAATKRGYAIVYDGTVVEVSAVAGGATGGLIQVAGLTKHKAQHIATALNPS
ncbi:MAG TPA: hypothetical protein VHC43_04055 [Mycobacteriales bacterium]|nr:hypothetical protein [Mycobacteriales bacterium]